MRSERSNRRSGEAGTTLVEVLIATLILATGVLTMSQMFLTSTMTNRGARNDTFATVLAEQKIEQLRALAWGFDVQGLPVSDFSSDTSVEPMTTDGGTGLQPSPPSTLQTNTNGYVDHVSPTGQIVSNGAVAPGAAAFTRRWSVEPLPTNPNNTLIIQVVVIPNRMQGQGAAATAGRLPGEARMITVKTRKAQ
jgi:type II secretory pathway pseudopilin PulG